MTGIQEYSVVESIFSMKESDLDSFGFKKDCIEIAVDWADFGSAKHKRSVERTRNEGACEGTSPVERDEERRK